MHTLTVKGKMVLPLVLDDLNVKRINKRGYEISGGQAQRTAIVCAPIHSPKLILTDELTGNLDTKLSQDVMEILTELNIEEKETMMDSYIMKFATMTIVHYFIKILWTVFLC